MIFHDFLQKRIKEYNKLKNIYIFVHEIGSYITFLLTLLAGRLDFVFRHLPFLFQTIMPGPPFAFGAILVILALLVAIFIPDVKSSSNNAQKSPTRRTPPTQLEMFQRDTGKIF